MLREFDLNNQRSTSVTQVIVRRISKGVSRAKNALQTSRLSKPHTDMDWEVSPCGNDADLERDSVVLRDLEAEIYALTDQFNTEQSLNGASSA